MSYFILKPHILERNDILLLLSWLKFLFYFRQKAGAAQVDTSGLAMPLTSTVGLRGLSLRPTFNF